MVRVETIFTPSAKFTCQMLCCSLWLVLQDDDYRGLEQLWESLYVRAHCFTSIASSIEGWSPIRGRKTYREKGPILLVACPIVEGHIIPIFTTTKKDGTHYRFIRFTVVNLTQVGHSSIIVRRSDSLVSDPFWTIKYGRNTEPARQANNSLKEGEALVANLLRADCKFHAMSVQPHFNFQHWASHSDCFLQIKEITLRESGR